MSDSVRPHRRQPTRLPRPWDSSGKNTGVGCHFLQCMTVKSESEVTQTCPTLSDPMDCNLPGSSIHGIFQARVLEWVAIAFSISWSQYEANSSLNSKTLPISTPPQDIRVLATVQYCTDVWIICSTVRMRSHLFLSLKKQEFLSNWVDGICLTVDRWINGLTHKGKRWLGKMVPGYLDLRPDLDCLFEASKCTQCSHSLAGNSLKFGELSATTAAIFQNAFCIFPQLWNVHQCTRQNLNMWSSPHGSS